MDVEKMKRMLADLEANPGGEMDEEAEEKPSGVVLDIGVRPLGERDDLLSAFSDENPEEDDLSMYRRKPVKPEKKNPKRTVY